MPEKYEAGSHNTIGIVGLSEAVGFLLERGIDSLRAHEVGLIELMLGLLQKGGCRTGDAGGGGRSGLCAAGSGGIGIAWGLLVRA